MTFMVINGVIHVNMLLNIFGQPFTEMVIVEVSCEVDSHVNWYRDIQTSS